MVLIVGDTMNTKGADQDPGDVLSQIYAEAKTASFAWNPDGSGPLHVPSPNEKLVYELRPNAKLGGMTITNSQGFRDYEFCAEKPAGTYRIVVLGDSVTFGWWERTEETYPKVLESLLNSGGAGGFHFEVYNMAVGGYNSAQEVELLKTKALAFHPDLVIVGFCPNDGGHMDAGQWKHFYNLNHSVWACRAESLRSNLAGLRWAFTGMGNIGHDYGDFQRVCRQNGISLLVVIFPWNPDFLLICQSADRRFRKMGLDVLNMRQDYDSVGWEKAVHGDDLHPTALGHALAAKRIYEHLKDAIN